MKTTLLLSVLCAAMAVAASVSCGSDTCADDEYCNNSTTTCQCNTTFYTFIPGSRPSPHLTCTGVKFNIQVSKCWLEVQGYNTSNIRLNGTGAGCFARRELVNGTSEMTIHHPLTSTDCNTVAVINKTHVLYTNQLLIFAKTDPIRIVNDAVVNISCSYPLLMNISLNVTLHPVLGTTIITGPTGNGSYAAVMMAYTDGTYSKLLSENDPLNVEDTVYLSVQVPDLDVNTFKLKVVNIYASATNSTSDIKYYLLKDGCISSQISSNQLTEAYNGNGTESRFAMKVFKIANSNTVYLNADLRLCTNDCNSACAPQSKSDVSQNIGGKVGIYLDASDTNYLDNGSSRGFSMPWTLSALIFSWILMKLM